jgi:aspartyl-tRNA(Asn)/glutamyl-tRNA(Gln) amidotransferase subunit A
MVGDQALSLTIGQASNYLRRKELSASELLSATLERIESTEPVIHAYAHVMADQARRTAAALDEDIQHGIWRGPLHGIPLALKDVIFTADAPTEAGSRALEGYRPGRDATAVARLRGAGAVIVGKTVTHEFAYGQNAPPTRNAWDPQRVPGSSSAGSAVAVAALSAFGALGTDTGGSVRAPASLNGVVGLKPTYGRVSRYGVVPLSPSLDTVGVLARSARDCAVILSVVAGFDPLDVTSLSEAVPNYDADIQLGVRGLRLGLLSQLTEHPSVTTDVRTAVGRAIEKLKELGAVVVPVNLPNLDRAAAIGMTISMVDAAASHERLLPARLSSYEAGTRVMIEAGRLVSGLSYVRALRMRSRIIANVKEAFAGQALDALVSPSLPCAAPRMGELRADMIEGGEHSLTAFLRHQFIANVVGIPAISVPCGFSSDNLPIGLQLMAKPLHDETLFRVAYAYEAATDWHLRSPDLPRAPTG